MHNRGDMADNTAVLSLLFFYLFTYNMEIQYLYIIVNIHIIKCDIVLNIEYQTKSIKKTFSGIVFSKHGLNA